MSSVGVGTPLMVNLKSINEKANTFHACQNFFLQRLNVAIPSNPGKRYLHVATGMTSV